MILYKAVEIVKDFFTPRGKSFDENAKQDALLLSQIASHAQFIRARNGVTYFYFFPTYDRDLPVAQFLFRRNGIKVRFHNSSFFYDKRPALRALRSDIVRDEGRRAFVESVKPMDYNAEYEQKMNEVRGYTTPVKTR